MSRKNKQQKVMYIFIGMLCLFLGFLITSYIVSSSALKSKEDHGFIINVAGRQRMLLQKYTKEFINGLVPLQVRHSTLNAAKIVTIQISEDRKAYTRNVFGKMKEKVTDLHFTNNYEDPKGEIPLPATFVQEVSGNIRKDGHYSYELLSKWNINKGKGLRTDFEKDAFGYLSENKGTSFSRFLPYNGTYVLRYATPDFAVSDSCVSCHNSHTGSPRNDFKRGDIMGMLVVNIPIGIFSKMAEAFFEPSLNELPGFEDHSKTRRVFEMSLDALLNGGKIPVDLNLTAFRTIRPTTNTDAINKLKKIKHLWFRIQEEYRKLLISEPNSSEYVDAYTRAYDTTNVNVNFMNSVVGTLEHDSQERFSRLRALQTIIYICLGVLFCLIIVSVYLKIICPLESQRETLRDQKEELRVLNIELSKNISRDKQESWLRSGKTGLNDQMRGAEDTDSLSQNIIIYLSEYLNAQVGTIYLSDDDLTLSLAGTYAIKNHDSLPNKINFGEGLIGQVVVSRESCIITSIPRGYREINSGLAVMFPKNLMIVPILHESTVKGVIELGSVHEFTNSHLDLMNQVAEIIGIAINNVQSNQCLKELLEESQAQTEQLQAGNEELTNIYKELEGYSNNRIETAPVEIIEERQV